MDFQRDGVRLYNARATEVSRDDASPPIRPSGLPQEPVILTARFVMGSKTLFLVLTGSAVLLGVQAAVPGFDISHYQAHVDFKGAFTDGARFVLIKVSIAGRLASSSNRLRTTRR